MSKERFYSKIYKGRFQIEWKFKDSFAIGNPGIGDFRKEVLFAAWGACLNQAPFAKSAAFNSFILKQVHFSVNCSKSEHKSCLRAWMR